MPGTFETVAPRFEHDKRGDGTIRVSNFLITLNTNVRFSSDSRELEDLSEPMYRMAEMLFGDGEKIARFVIFGVKAGRGAEFVPDPSIHWNTNTIVDYKVKAGVEIGHNKMGSRLHMHIALKIRHRSYIRLNKDLILQEANRILEMLGFPFPIKHINIRVMPGSPEDYLDK